MGILLRILLELVGTMFAPPVPKAIDKAADRLLAPLGRALRSPSGARVLGIVWLVCAGWMWLGFTLVPGASNALRVFAALISIFGSAILALWSTVEWLHRHDGPGRRNRHSAY